MVHQVSVMKESFKDYSLCVDQHNVYKFAEGHEQQNATTLIYEQMGLHIVDDHTQARYTVNH